MMKSLSKAEFMHKVINDKYKKKLDKREKLNGAETHLIENSNKIKFKNLGRKR